MDKEKNLIVMAVNASFVVYLKALLASIQKNWQNHPPIKIYLHPEVEEKIINFATKYPYVSCVYYNPTELNYYHLIRPNSGYFKSKSFIESGYFTLHLWSSEFEEYQNLLFLDADTLVLQNLDALFDKGQAYFCHALNGKSFPYFQLQGNVFHKIRQNISNAFKLIKKGVIPIPFQSINSGVLFIPKSIRTKEVEISLLDFAKNFAQVCPGDQDLITLLAFKYKWMISKDYRYNFQLRFFNQIRDNKNQNAKLNIASQDIKIIHFNGPKPNHKEFLNHSWSKGQNFWKSQFEEYLLFHEIFIKSKLQETES